MEKRLIIKQPIESIMTAHFIRRTTAEVMPADDDDYAVQEYKKAVQEYKNTRPHLSTGVIQQMALKRAKVLADEREQKKKESNLFRGMMSKITRIGKVRARSDESAQSYDDGNIGSTFGSTTATIDDTTRVWRNGRSIACRKSVASIESDELRQVRLSSNCDDDIDDDESLMNSLQNIEAGVDNIAVDGVIHTNTRRPSRRAVVNNSVKFSKRGSDLEVELSDVEEDQEITQPDDDGTPIKKRRGSGCMRHASIRESITKALPAEIKILLDNFGVVADTKEPQRQEGKGKTSMRQSDTSERSSKYSSSSHRSSSMCSVDSDAFDGDFSAWASSRKLKV